MIYEVTLSNGCGDHVEMIVEAETAVEAKRRALLHTFEKLAPHEKDCALNGDCPDDVRVRTLVRSNGVYKVVAFNHECGGF